MTLQEDLNQLDRVDVSGLEEFAGSLDHSATGLSRHEAIDAAIGMVDLTTLESTDTPAKIQSLSRSAMRPDPDDDTCPPAAAVCVYPDLVPSAYAELATSTVKIASVAGAFPSGRATLDVKLADVRSARDAGADEIDVVIDRGAFLDGDEQLVFDQLTAMKDACRRDSGADAHLKVILETGELRSYDNICRASWLAMLAGADFIKTSTGKIEPGATLPGSIVMLQAVRDYQRRTGRRIGVKAAGGLRRTDEAMRYLAAVNEISGEQWLDADHFRFGASSLLSDLVTQRGQSAGSS